MGIKEKLLTFLGIEDDDDSDEIELKTEYPSKESITHVPEKFYNRNKSNSVFESLKQLDIMIVYSNEDCKSLADRLKCGVPIIVNFNDAPESVARKVFTFVSGCVYALNGVTQKISKNVFLFAPSKVYRIDVAESSKNKLEDTLSSLWIDD